jgi:Raf kinase inhibitor-like YbhB/YbcL family protein
MRHLLVMSIVVAGTCVYAEQAPRQGSAIIMELSSAAFGNMQPIPVEYTCEGRDISPPLRWAHAPAATKSFALIMDDPDAPGGTWDHWLLYNISATLDSLPAAASAKTGLPAGTCEGVNSWGKTGWGGPCPPSGTHRYVFKLYALDTLLSFKSPPRKRSLVDALQGHTLELAQLVGTYRKQQ